MSVCFLTWDIKGVDADGKSGGNELGRVEGGETSHNILYGKNPFSIKEN